MSKKLRCFLKKITQLTKILHDRRSRQIPSLVDQCGRVLGIDWKIGQVLKCSSPSVELCNAWHRLVVLKCWSVGEGEKALSPTHARPQDKKSTEAQTDFISHSNAFNLLHCYSTFLNNSEQCSLGSVGVTGWRTDLITRHKTALTPDIAPVIPSLVFDSQIIDINGQGWGESTWPWPSKKKSRKEL